MPNNESVHYSKTSWPTTAKPSQRASYELSLGEHHNNK